ncbi:DUF1653 domain-containing protein [Arenicella xantha]|uniref:Antibiotic biosynthesis monooxygenase n=1 Tax=Arenicella xantha TaxID=644221 RepID=A0A395JEX4_9GAMM|nr:DUF1653 domain-containing protein [Arenicella xantha]RBP48298.1 antibiotic biosynthesis monooxygenase [Arenicella xantha]
MSAAHTSVIRPGLYQHYKGPLYRVTQVVRHSESEESLVVYQALYGEKGFWARPLTMFDELVKLDGASVPRFRYLDEQTDVLELAVLNVEPSECDNFEQAFADAERIIAGMEGYLEHQLQQNVERPTEYLLTVQWQSQEHHAIGFRQSDEYQQWRKLLHHFYSPMPKVEYYQGLRAR